MKALAIAATGMNAQQTNLEVIANNIANINTTGYKRATVQFSSLVIPNEPGTYSSGGVKTTSATPSRSRASFSSRRPPATSP